MSNISQFLISQENPGEPSELGCSEADVPKLLQKHKTLFERKSYCVVKDWKWCDISLREEDVADFEEQGVYPCFVIANHVIFDELERYLPGGWVRTSLLSEFHPPAIFETRNTIYILVGKGTRETKSIAEAGRMFL
jgi:hypothetical protein